MSVNYFLLTLLISVTLIYCATASPALSSDFIEQENSCREVCGLCNCDGFYCIDECICECNVKDEENLQCIADMKTECDKNGLEYELLMQESTKERFLRQAQSKSLPFSNFANNFIIMKQKRDSTLTEEPTLGASAPSNDDQILGAPVSGVIVAPGFENVKPASNPLLSNIDQNLKPSNLFDFPLTLKTASTDRKLALNELSNFVSPKLMMSLRDATHTGKPTSSSPSSSLNIGSFNIQPASSSSGSNEPLKSLANLTRISLKPFESLLGKTESKPVDASKDE